MGNELQEAGTGQAGGTGRAVALKAAWKPRQFTPHRNPPGFPSAISSLQAEGKVLAADPCMVGLGLAWGFLAWDPPLGITAPKPTISHKPGAYQRV